MTDFVRHLTTVVQLAAVPMVLYYLFFKLFVKTRLAVFGEGFSFLITLILNGTFFIVMLLALALTLGHNFAVEYLSKTGKSIFPLQIFAEPPEKNERVVTSNNAGLVKVFPQKVVQSQSNLEEYEKYSVTKGIEEDEPFYDNHCGLVFTPTNIDIENGTAQLIIGPTTVPADSLIPLKAGGLNYQVGGKNHLIYLSNTYRANNRKFIVLNISQ